MLVIRLQRTGKSKASSFRVVLTEKRTPPQGKFFEILGHYNPRLKEKSFKEERVRHWLAKGVQVSGTVNNLLVGMGLIKGPKISVHGMDKNKKESSIIENKPASAEVESEKKDEPKVSMGKENEEEKLEADKSGKEDVAEKKEKETQQGENKIEIDRVDKKDEIKKDEIPSAPPETEKQEKGQE